MRTYSHRVKQTGTWLLAFASIAAVTGLRAADTVDPSQQSSHARVVVASGGGGAGGARVEAASDGNAVVVSSLEPAADGDPVAQKDRAWLGVSIEEGSEALAAQLDLPAGAGLVVTFVAPDSPAAKAGLEKNDVLVELDDQLLVVPAQLRKLVQVHKEGDKLKLVYYRAGKKETTTATLGKAPARFGLFGGGRAWDGERPPFLDPFAPDAVHGQAKSFHDLLGLDKVDRAKLEEQVRRSMEQARKAYREALRASSNAVSTSVVRALRELQRAGIDVGNNASVTVRSSGEHVKSVVKADDSGTIVLVCNPKPRLTAHDKQGKLLFDGEIATPEQRAKVPPELWEKVEPLLDKIAPKAEEEPDTDAGSGEGSSSGAAGGLGAPMPPGARPTL